VQRRHETERFRKSALGYRDVYLIKANINCVGMCSGPVALLLDQGHIVQSIGCLKAVFPDVVDVQAFGKCPLTRSQSSFRIA
jgi:hypothetical protein